MGSGALTITPLPLRQLAMGWFRKAKAFSCNLFLLCTLFSLATYGLGTTNGMQKSAEFGACGIYGGDRGIGFQDFVFSDANFSNAVGSPKSHVNIETICADSDSFCFPSTLPGFSYREHKLEVGGLEVGRHQCDSQISVRSNADNEKNSNKSWSSDSGIFELLNGNTVSCFLNVRGGTDKLSSVQTDPVDQYDPSSCRHPLRSQRVNVRLNGNSEMMQSSSFRTSPSPHVEIEPPVLDWGEKDLYLPSVALLTVRNTCNDSILHIYEPFLTNLQFYPCNFSEILLGPGELASICLVYLPRWMGLSAAHLILQTSAGGFLVQIKGYGIESPYKISPIMTSGVPADGQSSRNLSLFNPFDETLYVKEVSAWISFSVGNVSHHIEAICRRETIENSNQLTVLTANDWLVVKNGHVDSPLMGIRPLENWEIGPKTRKTILEIEFSFVTEGRIAGAFCMQLLRSSQEKSDKLMIPLEVVLDRKVVSDGTTGSLSSSLEVLVPCNANRTAFVVISLRNQGPHVLKVMQISEVAAKTVFQIKYVKGLLLFPASVTKVATLTCSQVLAKLRDSPTKLSSLSKKCKLVVLTNDSSSSPIEIACRDVLDVCLGAQKDSTVGHNHSPESYAICNRDPGSLDSSMQISSQNKALEMEKVDEYVLGNWKSQCTTYGMSVLDDQELLFSMVEIGNRAPKWIIVKNPSQKPVVMQLILHSGEIIEDCRTDGILRPSFSNSLLHTKLNASTRYGFLMEESSLTEAIVHPYGKAALGPILFHPSSRCGWRSSALIRNNLSGVEWLPLQGFGGSVSLLLLEGSVPVQEIGFSLNFTILDTFSPLGVVFLMKEVSYACSQPLSKELHVKNIGDLPVVVKRIEISGTQCSSDGFCIHPCKGFSLEPGESRKLLISYNADFSASTVQKDLVLFLSRGMLIIQMKASIPFHIFNLCRKSVFWIWLKKLCAAFVLPASFIFLICYCILFQLVALGSESYSYKNSKCSGNTIRSAGKSSRMQRNAKNKPPLSTEVDNFLRSGGEDVSLKQAAMYRRDQDGLAEQGMIIQTPELGNHKKIDNLINDKDEAILALPSKSMSENSGSVEASQSCELTVRTGRERGRRRRKRKGVNAVLTGLVEVSSSQSGNSTPSSPLSPAISLAPNATLLASPSSDAVEATSPFSQVVNQHCRKVQVSEPASRDFSFKYCNNSCFSSAMEQTLVPRKSLSKHVLLPSATFPSAGRSASSMLPSTLGACSTIAPRARAPGPKVYSQGTDNLERKAGDKYTYDIWGHHLSGLHLTDNLKDVPTMKTVTVNNSNSFFVNDPQALVAKSKPKYVSCFQPEG
ncbi:hypothetical protein K2173_006132 [Erythroxylum novogranatense]|uniref:Transmembrane protein 131-like N-terminal domain-containing protein n=1 Tax=Erythroxylum novogranatense TaxID=1862640 RepID=A0AAV8TC08_9ROSI|nr:hypothetical protein K2173_006132 [Erythroxylum novogranatense]